MSTIRCYEPTCNNEVELSCGCTSPATYSCEKHLIGHCKSSSKPHNFSSIVVEPVEGTKEAILNLLTKEKSKAEEIKANIIALVSQTLKSYEAILEQFLTDIDSDSTRISSYAEKISQKQKLSKLEEDPVLNLLALPPNEASGKAKEFFTSKSNNSINSFLEMGIEIEIKIKEFKNEMDSRRIFDVIMNFDNELEYLKLKLNKQKEAIIKDPNNSQGFNEIGNIFYNEKRYEEAIKYYDRAIKIDPNCSTYYSNKGNALFDLGRREEAMECYQEAIKIDPDENLANNGIGDILFDEKRYEEALKYYNDAVRIFPFSETYNANKGNALRELGRVEEAMECYEESVRINPNNDIACSGIGLILYGRKNYEEALKYFEDAIRINPKNENYNIYKGNALKELGRDEEARNSRVSAFYKQLFKLSHK